MICIEIVSATRMVYAIETPDPWFKATYVVLKYRAPSKAPERTFGTVETMDLS